MKKALSVITLLIASVYSYSQAELGEGGLYEEYYTDGGDTIWLEYVDTSEIIEAARMPGVTPYNIGIALSSLIEPVNSGLYGIHIAGMF